MVATTIGALAGCSTVTAGVGSIGTPSAPSSTAPSSTPPASSSNSRPVVSLATLDHDVAANWIAVRDPTTGTRFALPYRPTRSDRDVNGIASRQYLAAPSDTETLGVSFLPVGTVAAARTIFRNYPAAMQRQFEAVGAKDFAITERRSSVVGTHPVFDMRISFTPLDFPDESTVWYIRIVRDGTTILLLQTIVAAPKTDLAAYVTRCRALQQKLDGALVVG